MPADIPGIDIMSYRTASELLALLYTAYRILYISERIHRNIPRTFPEHSCISNCITITKAYWFVCMFKQVSRTIILAIHNTLLHDRILIASIYLHTIALNIQLSRCV